MAMTVFARQTEPPWWGSAKKKRIEVIARAEVARAIVSGDDHGRDTVQFTGDSSSPSDA